MSIKEDKEIERRLLNEKIMRIFNLNWLWNNKLSCERYYCPRCSIRITNIDDVTCRYSARGVVVRIQPISYSSPLVPGDRTEAVNLLFELEGSDWKFPAIWLQEINGPNTLGNFPKRG